MSSSIVHRRPRTAANFASGTAAGAFDRQVAIGNIPATNISADNNLMTLYIAEKLGLPLPELGSDFRDFMRNLTPVDESAD